MGDVYTAGVEEPKEGYWTDRWEDKVCGGRARREGCVLGNRTFIVISPHSGFNPKENNPNASSRSSLILKIA